MDLVSRHISWGPDAANLTDAERQDIEAKLLADARSRREQCDRAKAALDGLPFVAVPIDQMASIYERMLRLTKLGQATVDEWIAMPPALAELKHAIFAESDFGAVYAGQWLPRDVRGEVRERVRTASAQELPSNAQVEHERNETE